jgi:WD40 repeat protein/tetratricopeptide (TPR) repeat protein
VILWDLQAQVQQQAIHVKPLRSPDLSASPFVGSEQNREVEESIVRQHYHAVRSLAFSPDRRWLAVVLRDGSVSLLDVITGDVAYRGIGHESDGMGKSLVTAYFTRDGELLTVGGDGTVRHWDLPAWSTGGMVPVPFVLPVARYTEGSGWVVFRVGGGILQWVAPTRRLQEEWQGLDDRATAFAAGRSDGKLVLGTESGRVLVFDLKAGRPVAEFKGPDGKRQPRQLPPLKERMAQERQWAEKNGEPLSPPITAVAVQRNGPLAASSWQDCSVDLWDLREPQKGPRTLPGTGRQVSALAFSPDGRQLAVADEDGVLRLWDTTAGKWQFEHLVGRSFPKCLCYSPDGRALVQAGQFDPLVWDSVSGKRLHTLRGHLEVSFFPPGHRAISVPAASYSPDGTWLATGGLDGTIRLWDARQDYQPMAVLSTVPIRTEHGGIPGTDPGWLGEVRSLTFSADARELIAVLHNSDIRVYDLQAIRAKLMEPAQDLLAETERLTGLQFQGDRLVPIVQPHRVRAGEPARQNYQQDPYVVFNRITGIDQTYLGKGPSREAREDWRRLLEEPGLPEVLVEMVQQRLARAHFQLGELDQAKAVLAKMLEANPNNVVVRLNLVQVYLQERRFAEAQELLHKTLAEPGLLPEGKAFAHHCLMGVHVAQGEFAEAETEAGRTLAVRGAAPHWKPFTQIVLANIYLAQWRFAEAGELLDRILATTNNLPGTQPDLVQNQVRHMRATLYLAMGEPDKAEAEIQSLLVANDQTKARAQVLLVQLYALRRQFRQAIDQFEKSVRDTKLPPDQKPQPYTIAGIFVETGELDKAEAETRKQLASDPNNPGALAMRAYVNAVQGKDLEQAEAVLKKLVHKQPTNLGLQSAQSLVVARQGHPDQALAILEKPSTNEVMRRNPAFFDYLGDVYRQAQRLDEARDAWRQALQTFPKTTDPMDHRKVTIEEKLKALER